MCLTALHEHVHARAAFVLTALASTQSACAAPPPSPSQERGVELLSPAPAPSPAFLPFDPSQSQGLFVGVRDFLPTSGFPEVLYAVDDAVDLAFLFACELHLVEPRQVALLLSGEPQKEESQDRLAKLVKLGAKTLKANSSTILNALQEQSERAGPAGLWILTFASHGMGNRVLTADSTEGDLASTSIDIENLFARLGRTKSPRKIVLLDVCREAPQPGVRDPVRDPRFLIDETLIQAITEWKGDAILLAARRGSLAFDDPSLKNGVFSAAVLDGLRCKAGHNGNGYVTVDHLADYVNQRVISWVDKNRPKDRDNSGIEFRISGIAKDMALTKCPSPCEEVKPRFLVYSGRPDPTVSPEHPLSLTGREVESLENLLVRADFPGTHVPPPECVCHWEKYNGFRRMWEPMEGADGLCTFSHPPPNPHESVVLRLTVGKTVHTPFTIEVH